MLASLLQSNHQIKSNQLQINRDDAKINQIQHQHNMTLKNNSMHPKGKKQNDNKKGMISSLSHPLT